LYIAKITAYAAVSSVPSRAESTAEVSGSSVAVVSVVDFEQLVHQLVNLSQLSHPERAKRDAARTKAKKYFKIFPYF